MTYSDERYEEGRAEERAETIANLKMGIIEKKQNKESPTMIKKFAQDFAKIMHIDPKIVDDLIDIE